MLYSLCSDGNYRIGFSEIGKIDGIEQIRIFAAEPWAGHRGFKLLEFYFRQRRSPISPATAMRKRGS